MGEDTVGIVTDHIKAQKHSHPFVQVFLSFDKEIECTVASNKVVGKCIIVNSLVEHAFLSNDKIHLCIIIEPTSDLSIAVRNNIDTDSFVFDHA